MTNTTDCQVRAGQRRVLHSYPATVLSDCAPAEFGSADWCKHRVRFETLAMRPTGALVETDAYGWEFGQELPAAPSVPTA